MPKYKLGDIVHISLTAKIMSTLGGLAHLMVSYKQREYYLCIDEELLIPEEACYDTKEGRKDKDS